MKLLTPPCKCKCTGWSTQNLFPTCWFLKATISTSKRLTSLATGSQHWGWPWAIFCRCASMCISAYIRIHSRIFAHYLHHSAFAAWPSLVNTPVNWLLLGVLLTAPFNLPPNTGWSPKNLLTYLPKLSPQEVSIGSCHPQIPVVDAVLVVDF